MMEMTIPNVIPPFEDELLYSYILRLADANGFDNISLFLKFYVNDQLGIKNPTIKYNSEEPLNGLVKYLHPVLNPDGTETDFLTFYLDHSMARFYHGYLYSHITSSLIKLQFMSHSDDYYLNFHVRYERRNRPPLNFCPKCMAEDKERYGKFYIHRIHQNTYAHLCPIHGCGLLYYDGSPGQELKDESRLEGTLLEKCEYSEPYTKMCSEMFDLNQNLDHSFEYYEKHRETGYENWMRVKRFLDYLDKKWVEPAKKQIRINAATPSIDQYILYLLYVYTNKGVDLNGALSQKSSQISMIKERIDCIAARE